jgi:hypothetical protein
VQQVKLQPLHGELPNLTTEATTNKNVVHGFWLLITENTKVGLLQSVPEPAIHGPTTPVHGQPEEEAHPRRRRRLPNVTGSKKLR